MSSKELDPARPVRRPPRAASSRPSGSCGWTEEFLSVQDPRLELPTCRVQVFRRDGTFVKEFIVEPHTAANGSVWDLALSRDPQQQFLYLADGRNNQVLTLVRDTGEVVGALGRPGRSAGAFHWVHDLAIDSKGNLYAGEVDTGKRAQRFLRR